MASTLSDRGSASGLYLAFHFFGGLMGAAVLGQLFDRFGWTACVAGIGVSLPWRRCSPCSSRRRWPLTAWPKPRPEFLIWRKAYGARAAMSS